MSDSRFQKNFYTDSQLSKGSHQKRAIRPNNQQENDFFSINYQKAAPSDESIRPSDPSSAMNTPWGVTAGATSDDLNRSLNRQSYGSSNNESNGEANFSKKQSENAHKVNSELSRIKNFYDDNPGFKVAQDHHKQRNMAERSKGVPWGTIDQVDSADGDHIKRKERMPAPYATAFNDEAGPGRRQVPQGQKQEQMVLSQVTF